MNSQKQLLKELQNRPYILSNKKLLRGLLSDCLVNEKAKVNQLLAAFDSGIVNKILETHLRDEFLGQRLISDITTNYGYDRKTAEWAINTWLFCIDEKVTKAWKMNQESNIRRTTNQDISIPPVDDFIKIVDDELFTKKDLVQEEYFVNVSLKHTTNDIFVPCGVGNGDNGFFICGLNESRKCEHKHANIYALIYNYLLRNSKITDVNKPTYLKQIYTTYSYDYKNIFRLMIIILQMIKNNYMKSSNLEVNYDGETVELKQAADTINNYAELFCRLVGINNYLPITIHNSKNGNCISLKSSKEIFIKDNTLFISNARELWIGKKINYRLTTDNLADLEYLLREISPFYSFKEGQFEMLKSMLAVNGHSVCIMPTGSGKSLIYYMISILQPLPVFVVSPTDILISDQIRNLGKFHNIDNVSHLKLKGDNDFTKFEMCNSLLYLTPTTFQNRHLLVKFRNINAELKVAYVVLDEIHCLSNWGHDFRAEYLMLSKFLNKFLDRALFLGFTATANYTVVEDIQKQLDVPMENIFSPISFNKYNITFNFKSVDNTLEMYKETCKIINEILDRDERAIVFTKNDDISNKLAEKVGYEADVFSKINPNAYHHFADNKCKVLISSEELGVGINFTNVKNVIHFGLPISKSEYIQEIGRAGRANEDVTSHIVYLSISDTNVDPLLLKREGGIDNISATLNKLNNDYSQTYRKLNNNTDSKEDLLKNSITFYESLRDGGSFMYVNPYQIDTIETTRKYLYMLFIIGYVNDWYSYSMNEQQKAINILVDINSVNNEYYRIYDNMLRRMKERTNDYFVFMGNNRESIYKVSRADKIEEVIKIYIDWYYSKFLYHHKEQFLDLLSFIEMHKESENQAIMSGLKEYLSLPFIEIKNDEMYFSKLSIKEISNKILEGMDKSTAASIERINSNKYSYKLDYLLFIFTLKFDGRFDKSRADRILTYLSKDEFMDMLNTVIRVYENCNIKNRFAVLKNFELYIQKFNISGMELFKRVFESNEKDSIYYGVIARLANKKFGGNYGK